MLSAAAERLTDDEMATCSAQVETIGCLKVKAVATAPDPTAPTVVRDHKTLKKVAGLVGDAADVCIDLETSGLNPRLGEIVGIGLAIGDDLNFYVPVAHRAPETKQLRPDQLPLHAVVQALHLDRLPLVAHNAKFELRWLRFHAGVTCHFFWDTMIAARLLASHLPAELEALAARELDAPNWSLSKMDMAQIQFLPVDQVARYCAKDCRYAMDLYRRQKKACLV